MELLNVSFAILILKITFCVLLVVFGVSLINSSSQTKRKIRNRICDQLFGVCDAIPSRKFARFLYVVGGLSIVFGLIAGWYLVLRGVF